MSQGWRRAIGVVLIAAAVTYLGAEIARNFGELRAHPWRADPVLLLLSLLAHLGVLAWGVFVWRLLMTAIAPDAPPLARLFRIWFLSSLARYIPGKVFQFVAVAQLAGREGIGSPILIATLVVHMLVTVATALLVGLCLLAPLVLGPSGAVGVIVTAAALAVFLVHPALARPAVSLVRRLPARFALHTVSWRGSWAHGIAILCASVAAWLLYGVAFHLLIASLSPLEPGAYARITAANALSFVAGFLSLLPAGLGVREVALSELLRGVLPGGVAPMVAVVARLWTIATELAGGALALALVRTAGDPELGH
jgi:glycosyltransferase 2 family protein